MIALKFFQKEENVRISFLFFAFLLSACQVQQPVTLDLPNPPELKMRIVEWKILSDDKNAYMCLTPESYSNLALNMQDLKVFIQYQNKIIKIYKYNH